MRAYPWWIVVKSQNEFKLKDGFECGATITPLKILLQALKSKKLEIDHWTR